MYWLASNNNDSNNEKQTTNNNNKKKTWWVKLEGVLAGINRNTDRSHRGDRLKREYRQIYKSTMDLAGGQVFDLVKKSKKATFCKSGSLPEATSVQDLIVAPTLLALNLHVPSIA